MAPRRLPVALLVVALMAAPQTAAAMPREKDGAACRAGKARAKAASGRAKRCGVRATIRVPRPAADGSRGLDPSVHLAPAALDAFWPAPRGAELTVG